MMDKIDEIRMALFGEVTVRGCAFCGAETESLHSIVCSIHAAQVKFVHN